MGNIICGDCLAHMATMEASSVDAIVTDPPYGLSFMGKDWDHGIPGKPFWSEAIRVAKPGAHLLAFGGTRTFHRLTCAIEDAGWEIRDCLGWLYGSGFPKSHNLKGEHGGWGTALKPAWEPIILARKPLDGTVAANVTKWGTGAVNVDGCRVVGEKGVPASLSNAGQLGWKTGGDMERKSVQNGRWPANLLHDGSEEVLELFPQTTSGKESADGHVRRKNTVQYGGFGGQDIGDSAGALYGDSGSAARFFKACPFENGEAFRFAYCAKASRKEREAGLEDAESKHIRRLSGGEFTDNSGSLNSSKNGAMAKNHHPTVKPIALMRYLCRLVTPPNGLILDPFCGSGTTGIAAHAEGFRFIGIDNNAEYVEIAERRINGANRD
jgi:site-specific DNA-methyltransferase (adenine-specific)